MTSVPTDLIDIIKKNDHFVGHIHVRPDADSIGSMLALSLGLEQLGKHLALYCEDTIPAVFNFLPGFSRIEKTKFIGVERDPKSVYLFVDTAKWQMATHEEVIPSYPHPIVNIDHHPDNEVNADFSWVDGSYSCCSEMILDLLKALEVEITPDIATCLVSGLLADTFSFKNQNVNEKTFLSAAQLMAHGAEYQKCILYQARSKSIEYFNVYGYVATHLKLSDDGKYVWVAISYDEWLKLGTGSIGEIANEILSSVEGTVFGAILAEKEPGVVKGSLRSREPNFDVSQIAHVLGGGGHKAAAGIKIDMPIDKAEQEFIRAVKKAAIIK